DEVLPPDGVGLDQQRTVEVAGESRRLRGRRGKVCARRRFPTVAKLLVRDSDALRLTAFDCDLLARGVAETRHRDPLARTEVDLEVPARAHRSDGPVAAGRIDVAKRHGTRVVPTPA